MAVMGKTGSEGRSVTRQYIQDQKMKAYTDPSQKVYSLRPSESSSCRSKALISFHRWRMASSSFGKSILIVVITAHSRFIFWNQADHNHCRSVCEECKFFVRNKQFGSTHEFRVIIGLQPWWGRGNYSLPITLQYGVYFVVEQMSRESSAEMFTLFFPFRRDPFFTIDGFRLAIS